MEGDLSVNLSIILIFSIWSGGKGLESDGEWRRTQILSRALELSEQENSHNILYLLPSAGWLQQWLLEL